NKKDKRKNDKKGKGKSEYLAPKAGIVKQKFQGTCYNRDQPGHRAANCKMPKRSPDGFVIEKKQWTKLIPENSGNKEHSGTLQNW
ncbi:hypothetical protein Tco_0371277, partial [Tanacetum coccineum]